MTAYQNGTLAVFVATQLFDNIIYMVPTAAYALVMMKYLYQSIFQVFQGFYIFIYYITL